VYDAYTPAYLGSYPYYGTVVFGTGWFYRPWWGAWYYPRPWTWGFHARWEAGWGWGWGFGWGPAWAGFRWGFGWGWGGWWCGPGAFFRPAFRNVNVTRNVTVTRNLYASGANATRVVSPRGAAAQTSRSAMRAQSGKSAQGKGMRPQRATPKAPKGRSGGAHRGVHGGGHKR
jgi:hypothetical protein